MTLLKISQGMPSNPRLIEGFEEGSSLPSAGLSYGGNPVLAPSQKDISQGKPLAQQVCFLFSLETSFWTLFRKNVTYKQIALAICASLGARSSLGRAQPVWACALAIGHPFVLRL